MPNQSSVDIDALAALADKAADEAGKILLDTLGRAKIEFKGAVDLVTDADKAAEKRIISMIHEAYPDHGILAEESGRQQSAHAVRWVIDPIDGTTNYAHSLPIFSVSIAVEVDGRIEAGVVYNPALGEKYAARRSKGATLNGEPLHVSKTPILDRSLLVTGFPYSVRETEHNNLDHFQNFIFASQAVRRLGSAALDLAHVARGSFDGYWETSINAWDIAAGWLIVAEAGGRVTDLHGNPLTLETGNILATNGLIHDEMLEILARGKSGL